MRHYNRRLWMVPVLVVASALISAELRLGRPAHTDVAFAR